MPLKRVVAKHLAEYDHRKWQEKGKWGSSNIHQLFLPFCLHR